MISRRFSSRSTVCLAAGTLALAGSAHAQFATFGGDPTTNAFIRIPADTDDWVRHFRLGAVAGWNISAKFNQTGNFGISGNHPAAGIFDDGYVLKDASGDPQYTSNWGYNNAAQLTGSTLTMHGTSSFTASGGGEADGGFEPGLDLAYGGNLWYWKHARVGWEMGFIWLPVDIRQSETLTATVNQSTYSFNTGGIVVPPAPYQGDPRGNSALIPYPANFTPSSTAIGYGTVRGTHELDLAVYTLRLGPSFYWDLTDRTSFSLGAGPAIGLVDGDYQYQETITLNNVPTQNSGKISGTDLVYGGYVSGTFLYHLQADADIYLGVEFMPMSNAKISGSGREGQLDLSGQLYFSLGINWPF